MMFEKIARKSGYQIDHINAYTAITFDGLDAYIAMKPINYYIDAPVITDIVNLYGERLERLTNIQKFELIGYLGIWVAEVLSEDDENAEIAWNYRSIEGEPDSHVAVILSQCDAMAVDEVCCFINGLTEMVTL
jgi:hypothetical protein